jgi:sugar phosphate isomerase/epimerase
MSKKSIQLGIGSYTFPWHVGVPGAVPSQHLTVLELIDKAVALDIHLIQIGDNHPLELYEPQQLEEIRDKLAQENCSIELGARGLTAKRLARHIELAAYFGSRLIRFVPDEHGRLVDLKTAKEIIKDHIEDLERGGITLALENHDRFPARELDRFILSINSDHVGICLDTVNSMGCGEGYETIVEWLAPHAVNLHIKDFTIYRHSHKMGFTIEGRIAGEGMLNIPDLLQKLSVYGRCHTAILEQWVPPNAGIVDTIKKEEKWAVRSIAYLRTVHQWDGIKPSRNKTRPPLVKK